VIPHQSRRSLRFILLAIGVFPTLSCNLPETVGPEVLPEVTAPSFAFALSSYFPPSEVNGGWRKTTSSDNIRALGMNPDGVSALGAYAMSLPWESYNTGVSGYSPSNKASLVIKNGWIVGERYNQESARNAVYYLASNGKTFAIMLMGRLLLDYPGLGLSLSSRLYDSRWLPQGFPLSDSRKARITFDHVFAHVSGIVPEVQAYIAGRAVTGGTNWNFAPFTVGQDADWKVSAPLYFNPGDPSTYTKGRPYSSVSFNHLSLIFRTVTGREPSLYLRSGMLDRIGVGRMDYIRPSGMGEYRWAAAGNGLASARDYARLMYLLLHEGNWNGKRIFAAAWIRNFTGKSKYPNLRSNVDCYWGKQYPSDLYWSTGSGLNIAFIVPSLDLVATLNGRTPNRLRDEVTRKFLEKLFASVTQQYVTCDGRVVNGSPAQTAPKVTALTLINADTDQPMMTMTNGMTLTLAELPTRNLNVRAATSPTTIGSVRFGLDGNANFRTETSAPYALAGDDGGNYRPWTPAAGAHTLKATPYAGAGGTGTAGATLTLGFTVK
jgi:CubicO group peptidase (beta-lactamase class C family)